MQRVAFRLQLRVDLLDEYEAAHANVWPEMLLALRDTGWSNYSLFLDRNDGLLVGYFETPDLEAALDGMAQTDVNTRWQELMSPYFVGLENQTPDSGFVSLIEVFNLEDQISRIEEISQN